MKHLLILITLWSSLLVAEVEPKITLSQKEIANGQVSLLCVETSASQKALTVTVDQHTLILLEAPKSRSRCAFIPVSIEHKAGVIEVLLGWDEKGERKSTRLSLVVKEGEYSESKLRVDPRLTKPNKEELKRMERDKEEIAAAYARAKATPLFRQRFDVPGKGVVTSEFGNRRTFNGNVTSWHQGVDLRAATGDPVYAANSGTVLLAQNLFLAGNTVIVDHGGGIATSYAHLSAMNVKPGQMVQAKDKLGAAGATGRVTGPHLHFGMRVNGVLVDPLHMRMLFNAWYTAEYRE